MNCYNSAAYLKESLDSVLKQTFTDWEIVFWDNQSNDESSDIFNSYDDKRFNYYCAPEHTNLGQARNLAVKKARGEWVAFLDCDDLWFSEKLYKQVAIIDKESVNLGLVYGHMKILMQEVDSKTVWGKSMRSNKHKMSQKNLPEGNIFSELLKENFVPLLSSAISRSAYWQVGGIDSDLKQAEDYDLFIKISRDFKVRAVQEVVCTYRVHQLNLSHIQLEDDYKESISIVSKYMPSDEAKKGIRSHQNAYGVYEIRMGNILWGFKRIFFHGKFLTLICKTIQRLQ